MTTIGTVEMPVEEVRPLMDPVKVINFLSDLSNRDEVFNFMKYIRALDKPGQLIYRSPEGNVYAVFLYKYPDWMKPDKQDSLDLALFIGNDLNQLISYFYRWFNKVESHQQKSVIMEVLELLYSLQKLEKSKQPQR